MEMGPECARLRLAVTISTTTIDTLCTDDREAWLANIVSSVIRALESFGFDPEEAACMTNVDEAMRVGIFRAGMLLAESVASGDAESVAGNGGTLLVILERYAEETGIDKSGIDFFRKEK